MSRTKRYRTLLERQALASALRCFEDAMPDDDDEGQLGHTALVHAIFNAILAVRLCARRVAEEIFQRTGNGQMKGYLTEEEEWHIAASAFVFYKTKLEPSPYSQGGYDTLVFARTYAASVGSTAAFSRIDDFDEAIDRVRAALVTRQLWLLHK